MTPPRMIGLLMAVNLVLITLGWHKKKNISCTAKTCVGLVFDVGGRGDKSFNDAAYAGLTLANEQLPIGSEFVEPGDGTDRESLLRQFADNHYDMIFGVGFAFSDDIRKLAGDYSRSFFVCIDYAPTPGTTIPANLLGIRFREHEGSFLVGAIAGLHSKTKVTGFIGAMKIPLIVKFEAGFRAGVKHTCPSCTVLSGYIGSDPSAFADPAKGYELAKSQYGKNADVIFHAAGTSGKGLFRAAEETGRFAIGVDSDQRAEAPCCVLTSMVKRVDVAVYRAIERFVADDASGGLLELGLADNGVGFVFDKHNQKFVSDDIIQRIDEIKRGIIAGDIEVPQK